MTTYTEEGCPFKSGGCTYPEHNHQSEPSLNSPLINKLVKDVAAIDTSRDMRSEPNTELKVYHTICEDGYRRELVAKDDVETLIAQKVAEAEHKQSQMILKKWQSFPSDGDLTNWLYDLVKTKKRQLKADKE